MVFEGLLFCVVLIVGHVPLAVSAWRSRSRTLATAAVLLLGVVSAVSALAMFRYREPVIVEETIDDRPVRVTADGYVSSDTCRSCHPGHYQSWQDSYHPRMTQVPSPDKVLGDFDGIDREFRGRRFRFEQRENKFWFVELSTASSASAGGEHVARPVVLMTGSHHLQVYWYWIEETRELATMPYVFLIEEKVWIPYDASFVTPPRDTIYDDRGLWTRGCIRCHTTHGIPGLGPTGGFEPTVAEFGIACEACHGPGEAHVRANRDPQRRYRYHLGEDDDMTVVHPSHLASATSSQLCGQCHGVWVPFSDEEDLEFLAHGDAYRPGEEITKKRLLFDIKSLPENPWLQEIGKRQPLWVRGAFWSDGMARVTGREYHGLIQSPCYTHGDEQQGILSCFSCHSMHRTEGDPRPSSEWADDQLKPGMRGDRACLQCHGEYQEAARRVAHTHHEPDSPGSHCYNCHMPYTTYGLLKAIRSHKIDSPSVQETQRTGRPNACNQCHLDKTLAWTAEHLEQWYGIALPTLTEDEKNVSASVRLLLQGDAGQRALMAWSFGWDSALEASGSEWPPLYLVQLLDDPYDAVRYIAYRSLRRFPGYEDCQFTFAQSKDLRNFQAKRAMDIFRAQLASTHNFPTGDAILIRPDRSVDGREIDRLGRYRDNTPITLQE